MSHRFVSFKFRVICSYNIDVLWRYTTYIGTRISFKPAIIPASKEKDKYSGLSKVLVYYDPQQPSQAVIEPGIDNSNFVACFVGLFFISVGVAYYLWS